jgi:hypothetical protein
MNIYENKYSFRSIYSFKLIKTQTDLKIWNNENMVNQTLFWSIQNSEHSSRSPLATLQIS